MKIAILQTDTVWGNQRANIAAAERLMDRAGQTDVYVLPEMWSTGFATDPVGLAEDEDSSVALGWMRSMATKTGSALCGSIAVRVADGTYRNRLYFVTPDSVAHYDKHHLFGHAGENLCYTPGDRPVVACFRGMRFLLLVCYDLRFPVWSRYGRAGEYDAILIVANWPEKRMQAWTTLTCARAIENQCYVVAANRTGADAVSVYSGRSAIIDPLGRLLAADDDGRERVLTAEIDAETLSAMRRRFPVLDDRDRPV